MNKMETGPIGYRRALKLTLAAMPRLADTEVPLEDCCGHVLSRQVASGVNVPSFASATKDGYALCAADIRKLGKARPLSLRLLGSISAGSRKTIRLEPGTTARIFTGGRLPEGTAAVVAQEHATCENGMVRIDGTIPAARNILAEGADISRGTSLAQAGDLLTPAMVGLLAAAGCDRVRVHRRPRVWLVATGNEIVLPGEDIRETGVYASNLLALDAFCSRLGISSGMHVVKDDRKLIRQVLQAAADEADAVITIGGSWKSSRDMVSGALEDLNWKRIYHHLRLIPGKSAGLGLLESKPVFLLPGSPPANMVAFLLLALPGLKAMEGRHGSFLPSVGARLARPVQGRAKWTKAIFGRCRATPEGNTFIPYSRKSRLRDMAAANALLVLDEDTPELASGAPVMLSLF